MVFIVGMGTARWEPFASADNLKGKEVRALEIMDGYLYAGVRNPSGGALVAGVWRRQLTGGSWTSVTSPGWNVGYTVRDLHHDPVHCQGMLAATDDGVWVFK